MRLVYQEHGAAVGMWRGYVNLDAKCACHQCSGDSPSCRHHYASENARGRGVKYTGREVTS